MSESEPLVVDDGYLEGKGYPSAKEQPQTIRIVLHRSVVAVLSAVLLGSATAALLLQDANGGRSHTSAVENSVNLNGQQVAIDADGLDHKLVKSLELLQTFTDHLDGMIRGERPTAAVLLGEADLRVQGDSQAPVIRHLKAGTQVFPLKALNGWALVLVPTPPDQIGHDREDAGHGWLPTEVGGVPVLKPVRPDTVVDEVAATFTDPENEDLGPRWADVKNKNKDLQNNLKVLQASIGGRYGDFVRHQFADSSDKSKSKLPDIPHDISSIVSALGLDDDFDSVEDDFGRMTESH